MKLNEYTKDEWFDIVRRINPSLTREQYDVMWEEFIDYKDLMADVKGGCQ